MEIKFCLQSDCAKAETVFNECNNRIRQQFGLYLHNREENIVDVLIQSKKIQNCSDKFLTDKILK